MSIPSRAFVSSTFLDLRGHREAVQRVIRQLGCIDVAMEHFGARDARPKEECLRLIRQETDIFLGIYAHRYGSVPEGEQESIVESEYDEATRCGIPRLLYMVDKKEPWLPEMIDKDDNARKIEEFKARISQRHIVQSFSTEDDLAAKVAADLGRYLSQCRAISDRGPEKPEERRRENRLIQQLMSADKREQRHSMRALTRYPSPWLINTLSRLATGLDEELAQEALGALLVIPGRLSVKAAAAALKSAFVNVRSEAAWTIGEMALCESPRIATVPLSHSSAAESVIGDLVHVLRDQTEDLWVRRNALHAIGKIGGRKALDVFLDVLRSPSWPALLKVQSLDDPFTFRYRWNIGDTDSQFLNEAKGSIRTWSFELCDQVQKCFLYDHLPDDLTAAIEARIIELGATV